MKLTLEKNKNSQTFYILLNDTSVAEVVMTLEDIRTQKCRAYFVMKEFNTQRKIPEEIQFYQECIPAIFQKVKTVLKKINKEKYLDIAEEEINETILERD